MIFISRGFIILLLILSIITGQAQVQKKTSFYESGALKEKYFVLEKDTIILDSLYELYAENGLIQKRGFYLNGQKAGHWVAFEHLQVKYSGHYLLNESFTGFRFYFENDSLSESEYYAEDNLLYPNDTQRKSIVGSLQSAVFDNEISQDSNFNQPLQKLSDGFDPTKKMSGDSLLDFYHTAYQFIYHGEWYPVYYSDVVELADIKDQLIIRKAEVSDPGFLKEFKKLEITLNTLLELKNYSIIGSPDKFRILLKELTAMNFKMDSLNESLNKIHLQLGESIEKQYPLVYETEFRLYDDSLDLFTKSDSLPLKFEYGKHLTQIYADWVLKQDSLLTIDSVYIEKLIELDQLASLKYASLYENELAIIEDQNEQYKAVGSYGQKLFDGNNLLIKCTDVIDLFRQVVVADESVESTFQALHDEYLQKHPPIYRKEIRPLKKVIAEYKKTDKLSRKFKLAEMLNDTIVYYNNALILFRSVDSVINIRYPLIKKQYETELRSVSRQSLILIEPAIKNYNIISYAADKMKYANEINWHIQKLEKDKEILDAQWLEINHKTDTVRLLYESTFPVIHKQLEKQLEKDLKFYEGESTIDNRHRSGVNLLLRVGTSINSFDTLFSQNAKIEKDLNTLQAKYETEFPAIFKVEVRELLKLHELYTRDASIDRKLLQAGLILRSVVKFFESYDELISNEEYLRINYDPVALSYKEDFSKIYKAKFELLNMTKKEYDNAGYHQRKLSLGQSLVEEIGSYKSKLDTFSTQKEALRVKYDRFDLLYNSRKSEKYIYKRGKSAYQDLMDKYSDEVELRAKISKGTEIIDMLNILISLAGMDNTTLNKELKEVKTTAEIQAKLLAGKIE
jgi:hypothetical protein